MPLMHSSVLLHSPTNAFFYLDSNGKVMRHLIHVPCWGFHINIAQMAPSYTPKVYHIPTKMQAAPNTVAPVYNSAESAFRLKKQGTSFHESHASRGIYQPSGDDQGQSQAGSGQYRSPTGRYPPPSEHKGTSYQQGTRTYSDMRGGATESSSGRKKTKLRPWEFADTSHPVGGLVRRKGEKNPLNHNLYLTQEQMYSGAAGDVGEFATGPLPPKGGPIQKTTPKGERSGLMKKIFGKHKPKRKGGRTASMSGSDNDDALGPGSVIASTRGSQGP